MHTIAFGRTASQHCVAEAKENDEQVKGEILTSFMIPEFFVIMDHIPLTPNGKPDLNSLPVVLKEGAC